MFKVFALLAMAFGNSVSFAGAGTIITVTGPSPVSTTYDESVNFAPPFSANQNDPLLADLFNPVNHKSGLCVPTTLANIVADQLSWRRPNFSGLRFLGAPEQGDFSQQIRYFARSCDTSTVSGTLVSNAASCMRQFYLTSGYPNGWVYLIGKEEFTDPVSVAYWHGPKALTIEDIRYYLSNQVGVLMDLEWEAAGGVKKGGHTFMLAGYDYDFAWGESQILLKVVNPENTYPSGDAADHYDEITMTAAPGFTFVLSGNGFPTGTVQGYVRNIMVFLPDQSVSPLFSAP